MALDMQTDAIRNSGPPHGPNLFKAFSSPEPSENGELQRHRRGYQACERCRKRKVKCDLGSVDAPHDPPCARCRREAKPCEFAETRKKRKTSHADSGDGASETDKRRRTLSDSQGSPLTYPSLGSSNGYGGRDWNSQQNLPNLLPQPRSEPSQSLANQRHDYGQRKPHAPHLLSDSKTAANEVQLRSAGAESTLSRAIASTHDNLLVLYNAANATSPDMSTVTLDRDSSGRARAVSNAITGGPPLVVDEGLSPVQKQDRDQALNAWRRMRFVRAGWFTPEEAMEYVEYFYAHLQPMTPVVTSDFRSPSRHLALLSEEPVLALTVLATASRHMKLRGHAHLSRSYLIHDQLWTYLQSMVQRLLWGQEQFGGGFCGGGAAKVREAPSGQITWKGSLRTLGTIEALLLLTDWQPRALHFPPGDDENRLLDVNYDLLPESNGTHEGESAHTNAPEHVPNASWLEPAWRSDKMSWMLLGLAQALSFELGVFDTNNYNSPDRQGTVADRIRKQRIRRLVLVYVAQTSGRMGIPSPLRLSDWGDDYIPDGTGIFPHYDTNMDSIDVMHGLWVHIASIMNRANRDIFPSRQFTKDLTSGDGYKKSIAIFAPLIAEWNRHYEQVRPKIDKIMQYILLMEYEYARLYINSLGLQNVVESWVGHGSNMQKSTMVKIADDNKKYIDELTDAALHILDIVVEGLGATMFLRDAPVRTFLRTLSAMMFTLKRLSLGNHEKMVRKCLDILDKSTAILAREVVDDVHLSSQTSRLVQNIVNHVKQTLIRVQKPANGSEAQSRDQSRAQSPQRQESGTHYNPVDSLPAALPAQHHGYSMSDPIAGIPARPMADLLEQTFMPPPNFNFQTNDLDTSLLDDSSIDPTALSDGYADWFALPLDNLWNDAAASVDQGFGGIGPTVGSRDMLEVITNQDYNQLQWNGPNQSNQPYQNFNGM